MKYRDPKGGARTPARDLAGGLAAALVFDGEKAMAFITEDQLARWHVSFDDALAIAVNNLKTKSMGRFKQLAPGLYASPWRDNYDAARLLLPGAFAGLALRGKPVVTVPNRDTLLVTGSEDLKALGVLASATEQAVQEPRPISAVPLVQEGATWRAFIPAAPQELRERYRGMLLGAQSSDYADQKELLDEAYQRSGTDLFVASFKAVQGPKTGGVVSYCTWTNGADSLLPRTDFVIFMDGDEKNMHIAASAPWARVEKVVGARLKPQGLTPERFRAATFPSDEEIRALGFAAEFPRP